MFEELPLDKQYGRHPLPPPHRTFALKITVKLLVKRHPPALKIARGASPPPTQSRGDGGAAVLVYPLSRISLTN